jgi:flagellar hook-basal body complex protein FliE
VITPLSVAKAYAAVQNQAASLAPSAPPKETGGFADLLKSAMGDAIKASKTAETQMAAQVQGKAELIDVATAISAAETSLQTVMAVRDQVISAYQEIMRMPI